MKNAFTVIDIPMLVRSMKAATIAHDCLAPFLNSYQFDSIYETEDDSLCFDSEAVNLEFFGFNNPEKRSLMVMYWKDGKPVIERY
jgi:hypothetical protein